MHLVLAIFTISIFFVSTIADESGIKIDYLVSKKECEKRTKNGDHISIHYRTSLTNGTELQSSIDKPTNNFTVGDGKQIKCYEQGLLDMCVGEKRKLTCHPHLAYGLKGNELVPAEAVLIFEVELMKIHPNVGLKYLEVKEKCEKKTKNEDYLSIFYRGRFDNGTEFDTNYGENPWKFTLGSGQTIKCYDHGLLDMCVGEKRELTCPPYLAYGAFGTGAPHNPYGPHGAATIPGDATLIFEVELVLISPDLEIKHLVVKNDCEQRAKKEDYLSVFYRGRFDNGTEFETNVGKDPWKFSLGTGGAIKCYDRALMNMCVGEKIELTCPPHLAYGEHGTATIPGNSTLIFEVELVKIHDVVVENTVIRKMEKCPRKSKKGDILKIHYKYGTPQQELVYSTYKKNEPLEFTLGFGEHWKAFDHGLVNMCIGEIRKIVFEIPHTGNVTTEVVLMGIRSPKVYAKTEL